MDLMESADERGVVSVMLNRPQKRNAFDAALVASLTNSLRRLDADPETRVIVLSGAGENFCAGGDVEWMRLTAEQPPGENRQDALALAQMFQALDKISKPTIAVVQGAAFGGGVGLAACCDIAIAATSAKFSLSEVRLGLIPAVVGPYVVRAIGVRQARALFLSGEIIGAEQALHVGLVHEISSDGGLETVRDRLIEALLLGAPGAQAQAKELVQLCGDHAIDAALMCETARRLAERRSSREGGAGLNGFLERRPPDWREMRNGRDVP